MLYDMAFYHYEKWHLKRLLTGLDSIQLFIVPESILNPAYKNTYELIISEQPESKTATRLKQHLAILAKNDFVATDSIKQYLAKIRQE